MDNNNSLNFHQGKYHKEGSFTMDDLKDSSSNFDYATTTPEQSSHNDYLNLNTTKKRSTQNERLRTQKSALETENQRLQNELAQYRQMAEEERQKAIDLHSRHLELTAEAAMDVGNTKALVGSLKDLMKNEASKYATPITQQPLPPQQQKISTAPIYQEQEFYSPEQKANINKLLDKFNFLNPSNDNPSYSPELFEHADKIQRDLLNEYKMQGRGNEEFGAEFTKNLEDRLNNFFNNNNNSNQFQNNQSQQQQKSSRMVAPVGGGNNFMRDSNVALQPEDHALIKSFTNHFGPEVEEIATQSFRNYRMHPEETAKNTIMKDVMFNPFDRLI